MHKRILLIFLTLLPFTVTAKTDQGRIMSGSDLRDWCKTRSDKYFKSKKLEHFNWSASTINNNNYFETSGEWRVENKKVQVLCRAKKGATKRQATFQVVKE